MVHKLKAQNKELTEKLDACMVEAQILSTQLADAQSNAQDAQQSAETAKSDLHNIQETNAAIKVQRIQRGKEARREAAERKNIAIEKRTQFHKAVLSGSIPQRCTGKRQIG